MPPARHWKCNDLKEIEEDACDLPSIRDACLPSMSRGSVLERHLSQTNALMTECNSSNAANRTIIERADDLPLRSHKLDRLPSEYLTSPIRDLGELATRLEADLLGDLQRYDIRDAATLRDRYTALAALAQMRGD